MKFLWKEFLTCSELSSSLNWGYYGNLKFIIIITFFLQKALSVKIHLQAKTYSEAKTHSQAKTD